MSRSTLWIAQMDFVVATCTKNFYVFHALLSEMLVS